MARLPPTQACQALAWNASGVPNGWMPPLVRRNKVELCEWWQVGGSRGTNAMKWRAADPTPKQGRSCPRIEVFGRLHESDQRAKVSGVGEVLLISSPGKNSASLQLPICIWPWVCPSIARPTVRSTVRFFGSHSPALLAPIERLTWPYHSHGPDASGWFISLLTGCFPRANGMLRSRA